jgi:hypothetical protein
LIEKDNIEERASFPLWLDEGMAEFFEDSSVDVTETYMSTIKQEHINLLRHNGRKRLIPLKRLLAFGQKEAYGKKSGLFYAESWCLVYYLDESFDLREDDLMLQYVETFYENGDPINSFESTFGMTITETEKDFWAFIVSDDIEQK